jgi:hypothetical protein
VSSDDDDIESARRARLARERIERERVAQQRRDPRRERSDPPEWPPPPVIGRPGDGNPSSSHPPKYSLWTGLAIVGEGAGRIQKRIAVLLAFFGAISVMIGAGMAYWSTHQGFIKEDRQARWEASIRRMELSSVSIETTVGGLGPRIKDIEDAQRTDHDLIIALRPQVTVTTTRSRATH